VFALKYALRVSCGRALPWGAVPLLPLPPWLRFGGTQHWFLLLRLEGSELAEAWSWSYLRLQLLLRSEAKQCSISAKHWVWCPPWLGEGWSQNGFLAGLLGCGLQCPDNKSGEKIAVGLSGGGRSLCHAQEKGFRSSSFRKQAWGCGSPKSAVSHDLPCFPHPEGFVHP